MSGENKKLECVINFMTEEYQKKLINIVQNRDETFEQALNAYKKLYITRRRQCHCSFNIKDDNDKRVSNEKKKNLCRDYDCMYRDSCNKISNIFYGEVSDEDIKEFFDVIKLCYSDWVNALPIQALERFECLLKEYNLLLPDDKLKNGESLSVANCDLIVSDIEKRVYYRGRVSTEFLGKMNMYHVPYNKRYIINNGRFSLTGQPLLYLGNSVVDVLEELEIDRKDDVQMKNFKVSSYEFKEKKRIFDLRCNIWHDLQNVIKPTFSRKKVFRNILSIICSFPKKRGLLNNAFIEEYVIPQMLAQILKQNNYDGICHYSTAPFSDFTFNKEKNQLEFKARNAAYRENLVVFTNFNDDGLEKFQYDERLYDTLEVSMPIGSENVMECTEDILDSLWKEIKSRYQNLVDEIEKKKVEHKNQLKDCKNCNKKESECIMIENCKHLHRLDADKEKAQGIYNFYQKTFKLLLDGNEKYGLTSYGKIQIQLLVGVFNRLLVQSDSQEYQEEDEDLGLETMIETCDLYGRKGKIEPGSEVHKNGMLHRAFLLILWKKMRK